MSLVEQKAKERRSLIALHKVQLEKLALFDDLSADAKKKRKKEIDASLKTASTIKSTVEALETEIAELQVKEKAEAEAKNIEVFIANWLTDQGVSMSNWPEFTAAYEKTVKAFKANSKTKFDALSDEVLNEESVEHANTIAKWFSGMTFEQKTQHGKDIFDLINTMVPKRLKSQPVKPVLTEYLKQNISTLDDMKHDVMTKLFKYLVTRTPVKSRGVSESNGNDKPRQMKPNSMAGQVEQYLENLGEGTHSYSEYVEFYENTQPVGATTKPDARLQMNGRIGKFSVSFDKANDSFTLTEKSA